MKTRLTLPSAPAADTAPSFPGADELVVLRAAPVQIGSVVEIIFIDLDTLSIEQHGVPNRGRGGIAEPERAEVELRLANAIHQLDA